MTEVKQKRNRWLNIRLTETEYKKVAKAFSQTTKRKISEYARALLLEKPVTIYTRNRSYDDFVSEMILLRHQLNAIGNNLNQVVKKLHSLDNISELNTWALLNENTQQILLKKIEEIHNKIAQLANQWSSE